VEQCTYKNVSSCLNTNIYSYIETSGSQSYYLPLKDVHFFNTSVNLTSVTALDCCFLALVYNMSCSIRKSPSSRHKTRPLGRSLDVPALTANILATATNRTNKIKQGRLDRLLSLIYTADFRVQF
jgi:hypothetical protein